MSVFLDRRKSGGVGGVSKVRYLQEYADLAKLLPSKAPIPKPRWSNQAERRGCTLH